MASQEKIQQQTDHITGYTVSEQLPPPPQEVSGTSMLQHPCQQAMLSPSKR